jgi:hypothetical protein
MPYKSRVDSAASSNRRYWKNHAKAVLTRRIYNWKKQGINMSIEAYDTMLLLQDSRCAICRRTNRFQKSFAVDHDHTTGRIRGLLCFSCNRFLVHQVEKNRNLIPRILEYLDGQNDWTI